jgi:hypothetical protein
MTSLLLCWREEQFSWLNEFGDGGHIFSSGLGFLLFGVALNEWPLMLTKDFPSSKVSDFFRPALLSDENAQTPSFGDSLASKYSVGSVRLAM